MESIEKFGAEVVTKAAERGPVKAETSPAQQAVEGRGHKARAMLRAQLGEDIFTSWFNAMEFESFDGATVQVSVPVKFLRNWIQSHYEDALLSCCKAEFKGAEKVEVLLRQPGSINKAPAQHAHPSARDADAPAKGAGMDGARVLSAAAMQAIMPPAQGRTQVGGFEGSPLDPRYTFDTFVVGTANRLAHAGATQVAETVMSE